MSENAPARVMFVAPVLPTDVIATAKTLEDAGLLTTLVTRGVMDSAKREVLQGSSATQSFSRRPESPVTSERTSVNWFADIVFYVVKAISRSRLKATDASFAYIDAVAAKHLRSPIKAVFAREDCCIKTFRRAKELGINRIYQLPTVYWKCFRDLIQKELAEFPGVCRAAEDQNEFASIRTERKTEELELADYVLCPSTFVRSSLPTNPSHTIGTIPFAIDAGERRPTTKPSKPVFLYAGNITMRKGIHRLLLAWKELKAYRTHELRLIGDMFLSETFLADFRGMFTHLPRVARAELERHYREASALVFNSMADGFGHVILEAMAAGTPVLASRNSGAPDVITDRSDSLLFNYGDARELASVMNWALSHPTELLELGRAAAQTVRKRTWQDYGQELLGWTRPLLEHE